MQKTVPLILFLLTLTNQLQAGRTLKIFGRSFSFVVTEPAGWMIDVHSAAQIANLVMCKKGEMWREADVVVFARFIEKGREETLADFVKLDGKQFRTNCPSSEMRNLSLNLAKQPPYLTKAYGCPGGKTEVVAFTELPEFFGVFVLSSRNDTMSREALPDFEQLLSSFRWLGRTARSPATGQGSGRR